MFINGIVFSLWPNKTISAFWREKKGQGENGESQILSTEVSRVNFRTNVDIVWSNFFCTQGYVVNYVMS